MTMRYEDHDAATSFKRVAACRCRDPQADGFTDDEWSSCHSSHESVRPRPVAALSGGPATGTGRPGPGRSHRARAPATGPGCSSVTLYFSQASAHTHLCAATRLRWDSKCDLNSEFARQ
jgi:hypothetical protein